MSFSFRSIQQYVYIVLFAIGVILLVITSNDLLFHAPLGISLTYTGTWEYWIFVLGIALVIAFLYMFVKTMNDTKKFLNIVDSSSKQTFIKNYNNLAAISKRLGPRYEEQFKQTAEKWHIK
ncbi:MAG: DUF3198 domain-containing protein [Candidatus Thermoplasmatota archaeon]|nr:DUF3198 domain-containing protein [Candidatus Thermoplasmatota archaeon]